MDTVKVDLVIKYALARAAHEDAPWARDLGPIHLLKYVYLADLAHAETHEGEPYTGAEWQFYNYGPWSPAVMDRITYVVQAIHAQQTVLESTKYENDRVRWHLDQDDAEEIQDQVERVLPTAVTSALRAAVHRFGGDTSSLLHHVYATAPMLHAAPHDLLDFTVAQRPAPLPKTELPQLLSRKQEKKREGALRDLKERAQAKLTQLRAEREGGKGSRPPRYDDVFAEGQDWLNQLGGGDVSATQGEVEFDEAVWKSPWRSDPGH